MDSRPLSLNLRGLVLATVCAASAGLAIAEQPPPLLGAEVSPRAILASGGGLIGMISADGRGLTVWNERGVVKDRYDLVAPREGDTPIGLALRRGVALIAYVDPGHETERAVVFDIERRTVRKVFPLEPVPSRIGALSAGWWTENLAPGAVPALRIYDDQGTLVRTLQVPKNLVQRATRAFGDSSYAFLRVTEVGGTLWSVPSLTYELWSMAPNAAWHRTAVPPCLAVNARKLEGRPASERIQQFASSIGGTEGEEMLDHLRESEAKGLRIVTSVSASRTVQSHDGLIAILLEPAPERLSGGCRLDVWRAGDRVPSAVVPIAGSCPSFVAMTGSGAWIVQDGHMLELPIALDRKADPCPS